MDIKGRIQDIGLSDIIQIFYAERKTVAVHLSSERGFGRIYVKDGELVHATCRDLVGKEALYELLGWKEGEFDVEHGIEAPKRTISEPTEDLLLEGLRKLGEAEAGKGVEMRGGINDVESMGLVEKLLELGILERI